jgi:hypothetical protein
LIDVNGLLLLSLTLTLGLSGSGSNEVFFILLSDGLGVCPLLVLLAALVWLASFRDTGTECELLLGKISQVVFVALVVVLWLSLWFGNSAVGWCSVTAKSLLGFGVGNSFTGLFISKLSSTFDSSPAMAGLLLRLASYGPAVTIHVATSCTTSTAASTSIVGSLSTSWSILSSVLSWLGSVVGAASIAVTESSFVAVEATSTTTSAFSCRRSFGSWGFSRSIALGGSRGSLVNDLYWWLRFLVRVFIVVIAEKLVEVF